MNVYDFDKTIYDGDSSIDFYLFALQRNWSLIYIVPVIIYNGIRYNLGLISKEDLKRSFFSFLKKIKKTDELIEKFWNHNIHKIKKWYLEQKKDNDLIISASPYFLLRPVCQKLDIKNLIASEVDQKTGNVISPNCHSEEKVRRYKKEYGDTKIKNFYTDSLSDKPLIDIAEKAYLIKGNNIIEYHHQKPNKIKDIFFDKKFLIFVVCGGTGTLVNFFTSLLVSTYINSTISYVIGYAVSIFVTYYLNIKINFHRRASYSEFIKFVISYIPNFLILFTFVAILINVFSVNKIIVYGLAGLLGIPITFVLVKIFAFKDKNN